MVYIHIPEALTEEEQMLMAKYAKLKKKVNFSGNIFDCLHFDFFLLFLEKATASTQNQTGTREASDSEATKRRTRCS